MKKVQNISLTVQHRLTDTLSCYELNDAYYVASFLYYAKSTEYFGQRGIHVWKTSWGVINKSTLKIVASGNSRKNSIARFNELIQGEK